MMKTVSGDLLQLALTGEFDVIIHGCNCFCSMGKGIAKAVKSTFPEAYEADRGTEKGDRAKLGSISHATVARGEHTITVVNGYTQFHWKGPDGQADYDAIRGVMQLVKQQFAGQRIGYPKIGAGLAGGDWRVIAAIITQELEGEDHTVVQFAP